MNASTTRERVLLVDDEPQVLVALEDLLADEFVILKTGSAREALNVVEAERDIAVIVTDQRMPKMSGDELLTHLEGRSEATRILVTGYADLTAVVRAVNEGRIFAYVAKPWQPDDLRLKVHRAAEHFRLAKELEQERRLLHDLMNNVPDGIYFKDAELKYLRVNRVHAMLANAGDATGMVGRRASELYDSADTRAIEAEELRVIESGEPMLDVECEYRNAALGRWFSESKAPIKGHDSNIGIVGITRDVTLRKAHQARISRLTRMHTVTSRINAAIVRTRERDELLRATCRIAVDAGELAVVAVHLYADNGVFQLLCSEPSDHSFARLLQSEYAEQELHAHSSRILELKRPYIVNDLGAAADFPGRKDLLKHGLVSFAALPLLASGVPHGLVTMASSFPGFFDSEETRLLDELADNLSFALDHIGTSSRLHFLAYHDGLTGLPNRDLLLDRASKLIGECRHDGRKMAVLLIDIERFRRINDTLGRRGGDELLVLVSQRLLTVAGGQGTVARFDTSFALLFSPVESEAVVALTVENEILAKLKDSFDIDGTELRISARAGIALFPADGESPESLFAKAETALKKAKAAGQPYLFYAPTMNARVAEQLALETKLRRAVEADEFLLHYQPKVDLKTGGVTGLEALIRWNDPATGLVAPGKFIPILEETGLIRVVGDWVLAHAAEQYRTWTLAGLNPPRIAANVSALQLAAPDFTARLERVLDRYPEASAGVDLEITESVFVDDLTGSIEKLSAARARGLSVSIDDFGTGYSSLSYLGRLPIDYLKIDRSFVLQMNDDPQSTSIVTTIISLAHSLGLKVIAEGVETSHQAHLLRLLGCDQAQGFLFSRPVPPAEAAKLVEARYPANGSR